MFNFPQSPTPLLDAIEKIHTIAKGSGLNPETLALSKDAVEQVAGHFSCTEQQAVLLAILLTQHYDNTEPSVRNLIEHTDIKASNAVFINQLLRDFVEKDWMKPKQDVRYFPFTEYKLDNRFIHCVTTGDWSPLQKKPILNSYELLETYGKCLKERRAGELGYQKLIDTTQELLNANPDLPLPAFLRARNLNPVDSMLFMSMCYQYYTGNESFDFDTLVGELRPPLCEQFHFRQQLKANEGIFFELELIDRTRANDFFMSEEQYRLTVAAVRSFHPGPVAVSKKIKSNLLELMEPGNIPYRKLFYPEKESTQMERLFSLMEADNFKAFTHRMQDKGMKAGLTVLLYGVPGTGKTESVLQLARQNGRAVMAADATAIRSKWVGETEKNIKQLFRDYQKTMQQSENIPILLFNEADAILGKRRAVTDRVEQMENTLQNILLQELENFEGIFIATTNMEENLDSAFDRRILYKVRFTPPADEMRLAIWKSKLPDVAEELLQSVNQRFHLTGGQIDNIVKKTEITRLLYPDAPISLTCLLGLAEEELSLRNGQARGPIGFGINRNVV